MFKSLLKILAVIIVLVIGYQVYVNWDEPVDGPVGPAHPIASCDNQLITQTIQEVMHRNPQGTGKTGECNPALYNNQVNNHEILTQLVEFRFKVCSQRDPVHPFNNLFFSNFDAGIYWFGMNNTCMKAQYGVNNPYYNPSRPTVIYVHGWEKDTTAASFRETMQMDSVTNLANAWIKAGYNFGIFYWNQLSDDDTGVPNIAESKIWTTRGPEGMRAKLKNGQYVSPVNKPASELFYDEYVLAMQGQQNRDVRIVGHSLGNQMAVLLTTLVSERLPAIAPNRVALLDPYYTWGARDYLSNDGKENSYGKWTGERIRNMVNELEHHGVAVEQYQSSAFGDDGSFGIPGGLPFAWDGNNALKKMTAFTHLYPSMNWTYPSMSISPISAINQMMHDNHVYAVYWYFSSFSSKPIHQGYRNLGIVGQYKEIAPTARSSYNDIRFFEGIDTGFAQIAGQGTLTPDDDVMEPFKK